MVKANLWSAAEIGKEMGKAFPEHGGTLGH